MLILNGDEVIKTYFVQPSTVALFKARKIPFSDLPYLLFYNNVSDDDLITILSYQRAMEQTLFGKKFTRYSMSGNLKLGKLSRNMDVLQSKIDAVYAENKSYDIGSFNYSYFMEDTAVISNSHVAVRLDGFTETDKDICQGLYQTLLSNYGYFKLYGRDQRTKVSENSINLAKLISVCLS